MIQSKAIPGGGHERSHGYWHSWWPLSHTARFIFQKVREKSG